MAHFAKLDSDNKVVTVEVVSNDIATTEQAGADFLNTLYGTSDVWKKTSYNTYGNTHTLSGTPFRKNFAGAGFTYDSDKDAFIPPKPYASWTLNETTCMWESPIPYPDDDKAYAWDEQTYQEDNAKVFAFNQGSGVKNVPVLTFLRNNTYVFDVSDNSCDGYSLGFKFNHGTDYATQHKEYTNGVTVSGTAGTSGATVTIAVHENCGRRIKYYCKTNGDNLGNDIIVNTDSETTGVSNSITVTVVDNASGLGWMLI